MGRAFIGKTYVQVILISLVGLLVYSNTLNIPFQWDEDYAIKENPIVRDLSFFSHPSEAGDFGVHYNSFRERYVGYLSFALNYRFHGLQVTGYHVVNIALHIFNALLVYALMRLTLRTPFFTLSHPSPLKGEVKEAKAHNIIIPPPLRGGDIGEGESYMPLFVALLFVSHPVQTEAVNYIMGRLPLLMWFFYLSSMVLYIKWRLTSINPSLPPLSVRGGEGGVTQKVRRGGIYFYLAALLCAVLAMKTKENALSLPLSIALYEFLFFSRSNNPPQSPLKLRGEKMWVTSEVSRRLLYILPFMLTLLIIPLSLISFDVSLGETMDSASRHYTTLSRTKYLFTQFRVLVTYLRLLFLPINQSFDYGQPVYTSFFAFPVVASFLLLTLIFSSGIFLVYRSKTGNPALRLMGWGIMWFFLTLSVESSIFPIPMTMCEYRLYAPSVGVFMAVAAAGLMLSKWLKGRKSYVFLLSAFILIPVVFIYASHSRNKVWASRIGMWEDVVKKSPLSPGGHFSLGYAYGSKGMMDKAIEQYQIAIKLWPDYPDAHNNLCNAYQSKGQTDLAIEHCRIALRLEPDYPDAHFNMGNILQSQGSYDEAIGHYRYALRWRPDYADAHYKIGIAYLRKGMMDDARIELEEALKIDPGHYQARLFLNYATKSEQ